jgi:hypothetical protein
MNLLSVRQLFVEQVGIADLVRDYPSAKEDNGADRYINEGQRFLDGLLEVPGSRRSWLYESIAGDSNIIVKGLRVLEGMSVMTSDGMVPMTYKTPDELRVLYPTATALMDTGVPVYYSTMQSLAPEQWRKTASDFTNLYPDLRYGRDDGQDGIAIRPVTDDVYTLEISGLWFSKELMSNDDTSWWTVNRPFILIQAASLMIEMLFNNTAGVADKMNALTMMIRGIENDNILTMISGNRRMRG